MSNVASLDAQRPHTTATLRCGACGDRATHVYPTDNATIQCGSCGVRLWLPDVAVPILSAKEIETVSQWPNDTIKKEMVTA